MSRNSSPEADALLDVELPVLDQGFVRLVDYMGNDARIVQSARVSYGAGTKTVREDKALIDYLVRNLHTSPLEQVELVFHIRCPIFIARQQFRHRTANVNEKSGRYSVMEDRFFSPEPEDLRAQGALNKQEGSGQLPADNAQAASRLISHANAAAYATYEALLAEGVCREQARSILPVGIYTEFYWKQDLHNLFHFLGLRLDHHAQLEIRVFAEQMALCAKAVAPMAYEAFERHRLNGMRLSEHEIEALGAMVFGELGSQADWTTTQVREFEAKLDVMRKARRSS